MTSHIGAFIQNTIKPLVEQVDELLGKCKHLNLDKEERHELLVSFIGMEYVKTKWYCVTYIILGVCFCLTTYFILK